MARVFRPNTCGLVQMAYSGPVEFLVPGLPGSPADRKSTQRHFSQYGHVDRVKKTDEGLLVTINNTLTPWPRQQLSIADTLTAAQSKHHTVNGHRVKVHLLRPNVYGCDVIVTRHRVSVTVCHEVIRRITKDETYEQFIQPLPNRHLKSDEVMFSFLPNQIEVQLLQTVPRSNLHFSGWEVWEWELCVLQQITAFLKPFRYLLQLPRTLKHTSCRERCINHKCRKKTPQSKSLGTLYGEAIAVFHFTDESKLHVFASEDTRKQLRQRYPTIDNSCDTGMKTLTLRGPARAVYQARDDMCSLVKNLMTKSIDLDPWKTKVLNNPAARKRIQRTLGRTTILCFWEISELVGSNRVVKVTASQKDQPSVQHVLESGLQTITVPLDESQKSILQSDAWKICLEGLHANRGRESAPVVDVSNDNIVICGVAANIQSSCRTVLECLHNNVVQTYPQLYDREVEEVITGLKSWQMKLLTNTNLKERINKTLPDLTLLDVQSYSLVIRAPLRVLTKSVSRFWRFVASLSQRQIHLTTALAEMYKQPAARSKVQTLVKAACLTCHWNVEDDHITVSAEDADQERLKQIFTSAFSEAIVHVAPGKSHLLRSEDFHALVTELQGRKSGFPTPVTQTSPGNNYVVIVDESESCATVQRAIEKFFENHDALTSTSQKETQTQSPQHENVGAQTEVEEIQTEERHQQTGVQNLRNTEQQTENKQLENKEQQTQDSSKKEQRTERPMLTENGFQTENISTKEQQLQTDQIQLESTGQQTEDSENDKRRQTETRQLQSNESQLRKENTNSETRRTQTEKQQPENQPMQTQREHRQTQTDDSENKNHEQSLHERMETQGTQTTLPDFKNKKQASPQTERTPSDEEVAPSEQDHQRRMQRSDVQSDSRDCPAHHQHYYPRHDNVGTAQYTCQEDIKTGGATQEDSSETFPKYICDSQQGQGTPPQDHATPSGDIVQQRLLCLTVEQLLEVATHLGIGRQTLDQLQFRCPAPDDLKRRLTETCLAASDTETLFVAVLRLCARPAVTGSSENSISHHRNSQTAPMSTAGSEHLSATISVEHCDELSVHSQCNQLATGAQLTSSFSTETQGTVLESHSDIETGCLIPPLLCNPQPLNSVDPVDLLHCTQADPCLFSGMSTTADLQGSESSTSSGQYTPVLASMLLSSAASSGPLSPRTCQQQVTRPARTTRSAQRSSLFDHQQANYRGNTVASDWHSRVRVDLTNRAGNDTSLPAAQPQVIDVESLVQINQRLRQLETLVMQRDHGPHPPPLNADCHARIEAHITQRFHQVELQMLDRLDALVQLRLQSASVADSRVYLSQMRAMEIEMQARMESQLCHLRAQTMTDVRREIDIDVRGVIAVDNASSSSSHSAPPSEVSD